MVLCSLVCPVTGCVLPVMLYCQWQMSAVGLALPKQRVRRQTVHANMLATVDWHLLRCVWLGLQHLAPRAICQNGEEATTYGSSSTNHVQPVHAA